MKEEHPVLSIIIPCYNHGIYINDALQSIAALSGEAVPYEIIIVNDGSTDALTVQVMNDLSAQGYTVINQPNQGLGATRNNAIRMAKGKYILPLDSDNKLCKPYLTTAVDLLEKDSSISIVYSDLQRFGEDTAIWHRGEYNLQRLMLYNYIDACGVYRKSLWEEIGGYDEKMPVMGFEDWEFWLRASFAGYKFHYLQEIGFEYRVVSTSMINAVSSRGFDTIVEYLKTKHKRFIGPEYIREKYLGNLKERKSLFFKLFLAVMMPGFLRWLKKRKLIKSENVL